MTITYQPQYRVHGQTTWISLSDPTNTLTTYTANFTGGSPAPGSNLDFQVIATDSVSGQVTTSNTIQVTLSSTSLTAPPQAAAVGFVNPVFAEDFTSPSTIATNVAQVYTPGINWYWYPGVVDNTTWNVNTTAHATGTLASAQGGILTLQTSVAIGAGSLISVAGGSLNSSSGTLPPLGNGVWQHGYFEAYIQFNASGNQAGATPSTTGWPKFSTWSANDLLSFGFGGATALNAANSVETTIMENEGTITFSPYPPNTAGSWGSALIQHPANTRLSTNPPLVADSGWHAYGMLWRSTGTGVGQVSFYLDNTLITAGQGVTFPVTTGTSQVISGLETMRQFMVLYTGVNWPMAIDWVRVWQ